MSLTEEPRAWRLPRERCVCGVRMWRWIVVGRIVLCRGCDRRWTLDALAVANAPARGRL